jgi:hypothetical protein
MYIYLYIYMQVKGTTVFTSRQWQVIRSKRSYDKVMGLLPSTLFERHPSFFCFLFSRTWEVTVRSRWRDHQNNLDTNKIRTKFSNTFLFLNFEFNTYTSILTLGPKQTQPETLTLTITPTQGLTDTMSTFRLFLLDMVRQGGCHAVTLFLFWITFIVSKKCAQRISFFFPPSSSPDAWRPEVLREVRKVRILKNVQINSADRTCPSFSSIYK